MEFGRVGLTFTRVANPDRVLDEVAAEADRRERSTGQREAEPLHLPYWAELWDSANGLATFLATRAAAEGLDPADRSVLDLGCGMGLSGSVAASLGACVLFADLESPALLFARLNSLPWQPRVRTRRLNWQTDRLPDRFDLILGADILYERQQWPWLNTFWRHHLAAGGSVLLGEPGRPTGDLFPDWARESGWAIRTYEVPVPTRPRPIRLLELRLPG